MLKLKDIKIIYKNKDDLKGYFIEFKSGKKIHITKRRTIIALLILIQDGEGSEADIAKGNTKIAKIKKLLKGRIPDDLIQDYYGDANKPYSELWNEEGFTFIDNLKGGRAGLSQKYTLKKEHHSKLFEVTKKANRKAPSKDQQDKIKIAQKGKCNLCGSQLMSKSELKKTTYAKDRRRLVFDHRHPVEKGGDSSFKNYQALCFYCNKSKWQICNICELPNCDSTCALNNPEKSKVISPTKENISDVLANRRFFNK